MGSAISMVLALAIYSFVRANQPLANVGESVASVTPDVVKLWANLLRRDRPLILAIQDPSFRSWIERSHLYQRIDAPDEQLVPPQSRPSSELGFRGVAGNDPLHPVIYAPIGESEVAFRLGRVLGPQGPNTTVTRASELSWKELCDNNVVFAGNVAFFEPLLNKVSSHLQFVFGSDGIENLHPMSGEPQRFVDEVSAPPGQGKIYALVSRIAGPTGNTEIEAFMSLRSPGYIGAVESFTDPSLAHALVSALQSPSGKMPSSYHVVLKVRFKQYSTLETSLVTYRELR